MTRGHNAVTFLRTAMTHVRTSTTFVLTSVTFDGLGRAFFGDGFDGLFFVAEDVFEIDHLDDHYDHG